MSVLEALGILLAGMAAGTINTIVGSGTLITFPTLLFFGYPAVTANVSNTVGLVAGGVTGVHGYRAELKGSGPTLKRLTPASLVGGVVGAVLLLVLPAEAFQAIVPALIGIGLVLVVFGPALQRRAARRHEESGGRRVAWHAPALVAGVFIGGVYGGYFGAAQGVILIALLGIFVEDHLQRLNALKNVMTALVNGIGAVLFAIFAPVAWVPALLLALGATVGGQLGARFGRRLPPNLLRLIIVGAGLAVTAKLFLSW